MKQPHQERVITDVDKRKIILSCTCGRQQQGLVAGTDAIYADASAWASHFYISRNDV